jgi:hypothetical protein
VADEEGVILIEKPFLCGQVFGEKRLKGAVAIARRGKTKAADDAPGIGIDDEDGLPGGIEDYGIGSLFPDPMNGEKLLA